MSLGSRLPRASERATFPNMSFSSAERVVGGESAEIPRGKHSADLYFVAPRLSFPLCLQTDSAESPLSVLAKSQSLAGSVCCARRMVRNSQHLSPLTASFLGSRLG